MAILDRKPMYAGVDYTGKTLGHYTVLRFIRVHVYPSGHSHHIWEVQCECGRVFELQSQKVMKSIYYCSECKGSRSNRQNSSLWQGGRHVPKTFCTRAKTKLIRKSKTIEWKLSLEDLDTLWEKQDGRCYYTGWPLEFGTMSTEQTASLDRTDSRLGYIRGNVRFVHKNINIMKWSMSEEEFLDTCQAVVNK